MKRSISFLFSTFIGIASLFSQNISDDFEGNGNITTWFGDACTIDTALVNPHQTGINTSATVLKYHDLGGLYANTRFDIGRNLNLTFNNTFELKVYVPSTGLTGSQPNQISLKLQDGTLGAPWSTQSEIIKPIVLDQWQVVTFDFANDPYVNLDPNSPAPTQRTDFNRVVIQINGENNTDHVLAYIDDVFYADTAVSGPVFNHLVWSDEFNGSGAIDTSKWFHQTIIPNGTSWFNGEIQHYTDRTVNSHEANGSLQLIAKRESYTNQNVTKQFTSARLNSKFAFTYGRVEIRAKLPTGVGTWPAFWMLGQNIIETGAYWQTQGYGTTSWPACGEIDIMEHWGSNQNFVQSAMHTPSSFGGTVNKGGQPISTASSAFHIYSLEWDSTKMVFSVDSQVHYVYQPTVRNASTWPFDAPQYVLFNIAILPSIAPGFNQDTLEVDYIRVYQQMTTSLVEEQKPQATELHVYPNPVHDQLNIVLNDGIENTQSARITIYNTSAQLMRDEVVTVNGNRVEISDLDQLRPSIYIGRIEIGYRIQQFRFVRQ